MILTERNVNEETSFWTIHLDYSIIGIVSHPSYDWDLICLCSSFSRLSPNGVAFLGQQLAWIGVGCVICLIVTILARNFFGKSLPFFTCLA